MKMNCRCVCAEKKDEVFRVLVGRRYGTGPN
jgi:hypothetical protein